LAAVASLVSVHHLRLTTGLVGPVSVLSAAWYFGVLAHKNPA